MTDVLHNDLPPEMSPDRALPGVQPLAADDWLRVSDACAGQMAERRARLAVAREAVLFESAGSEDAAAEVLEAALRLLPGLGFAVNGPLVTCPDGFETDTRSDTPLAMLGQIVQEDICILEKRGSEHVLTAAVLCFPAGWTLSEKAGRPLTQIHTPVESYDAAMATRVQRLFDGVQAGRPLWRNNWLKYDAATLYQPHSVHGPRRESGDRAAAPYIRAERQCILRLPRTRAVVFTIHTYVVSC